MLTKINEYIKINSFDKGAFIFSGITNDSIEIFEVIEPLVKLEIFYYYCSNKFILDNISKYFEKYEGNIIFANGNECIIYEYNGQFNKIKHINANLIKRHKKGGQSSLRFSRLADESRIHYVNHIMDYLNLLTSDNIWLFGSEEITNLILTKKNNINYGGFYDFNKDSINNTNHWLSYLQNNKNYDKYYEEVILYLDTNVDILDFDINNKTSMKYYLVANKLNDLDKNEIPILCNSKYYNRLSLFEYIGIKYFNYEDIN